MITGRCWAVRVRCTGDRTGRAGAELKAEADELVGAGEDKSMFWMSYLDFCKAFNRFYITRLFPPTWQQLTLHSGAHHAISRANTHLAIAGVCSPGRCLLCIAAPRAVQDGTGARLEVPR